MGRVHPARPPRPARSRTPLHRRLRLDAASVRTWGLLLLAGVLVAVSVAHALDRAGAAERRWGRRGPVLVAARPIRAGAHLGRSVTVQQWPVGLIPPDALRALPPNGSATRTIGPVGAGTPITATVLERSGSAGSTPPGGGRASGGSDAAARRRVAVPVGEARLPVHRGDRVDLWATADPSLTGGHLSTSRLARGATVVAVSSRAVVVAVRTGEVPAVAAAVATATVTLVAVD